MVRVLIQVHRTTGGELRGYERLLVSQSFDPVLRLPFYLAGLPMLGPLLALVAWLVAFRKPPVTRPSFEARRLRLHRWLLLMVAAVALFGLSYLVIRPLAYDQDWLLYVMGFVFGWTAYAAAFFTALRLQRVRFLAGATRVPSWALALVALVSLATSGSGRPLAVLAVAVPPLVAWLASRDTLALPEQTA
jgi:hypothetical protein